MPDDPHECCERQTGWELAPHITNPDCLSSLRHEAKEDGQVSGVQGTGLQKYRLHRHRRYKACVPKVSARPPPEHGIIIGAGMSSSACSAS